jgi:hypothetical protein
MQRLSAAIAFILLGACSAFADLTPTSQPVRLTTEAPIVSDDNCLVQRFRIDIAKGTPDGFITSEWVSTERDACLYPSAKDQSQTVIITVVAMVGRRDCMVHMNYAMSHRAPPSFRVETCRGHETPGVFFPACLHAVSNGADTACKHAG